jgi:hypothetical protein
MAAVVLNRLVWRRCLLQGMVAVVALAASGCKAPSRETVLAVALRPQPPAGALPTAAERAAAPHITADEIYTVYSQNLIQGANPNQRFRNRLLWVGGVFDGVNRGLPGRPYLELRTHDESAFTYATVRPEAESLLSTLRPGMRVELLCIGNGAVGGSPLLRDCLDQ